MALLFCDSFDAYTAYTDATSKGWTVPSTNIGFSTSGGKYGGGYLGSSSAFLTSYWRRANVFSYSSGYTLCAGFWFKQNGASLEGVFGLDTNPLLVCNANGFLGLTPYGTTTLNGTVGTHQVCDNNYHWIEMKVVLSTTTSGSITCYVDGVADLSISSVATISSGTPGGTINIGTPNWQPNASGQGAQYFDDVIVYDTTGSFMNSFPLGPRRIGCLIPNGAGASTQFTPSSGTNYSCVAQAYSGSAYVEDAGTGNLDLYATAGLAYTPSAVVNAVVVNTFAENPAGDGTKNLIPKLRSGASPAVASGATHVPGSVLTSYQDVFYQDSSATNWTATTVNSSQPGVGD